MSEGTELLEQILLALQKMENQQTASIILMHEWFNHEKTYIEEIRARMVVIDARDAEREVRVKRDSELHRERLEEVREREKMLDGRSNTIAELDAVMFLRGKGYNVKKKEATPHEPA